ncbi:MULTISPECIES: DUF2333 family protein [unclassified Mesorhizobium]|uniref:DUF2333 family protein n=1 Tax=unclassified Mesorhizobium TaxID=325217 RepID=UPI0009640A33|nr:MULTISPECIES: DUF2333 family protein [unclassified Mesorhizobium]MBN9254878.1 DUF2333 family protein [Mesorhizobium sp.]MBN9273645.1 DUF2333 family protein [Mesorhizobium sp.]OJX72000.1 MAG: hypothetical protein BGO93_15225 [Mesorhizobium sp. 65-26]
MLDPIVNFFTWIFQRIGRGIGLVIGIILWPFMWVGRWYGRRGLILRAVVGVALVVLIGLYAYFFYVTQFWRDFDPDYPARILAASNSPQMANALAGDPVAPATQQAGGNASGGTGQAAPAPQSCKRSEIAAVTADLIDFNVNRNAWISSMLVSKLGFFGMPWRNTPFFDNKAAFQLGINQVLRRTTTELVDTLGRARGTSRIDQNLQDARTAMSWDESAWYIGVRGPTRPTPSVYREAIRKLGAFNDDLAKCQATFDARADNLLQFLDRIAGDMGSTSDILRGQIEASDAGWFDPRADDRFWFAYGQLYAYYGILSATRSDFTSVIRERNLATVWDTMQTQMRDALNMQPWIISNGNESSFIFPSHLATMGFNLLRARSQIVEIRGVLDR